jgi:hypothetical protein
MAMHPTPEGVAAASDRHDAPSWFRLEPACGPARSDFITLVRVSVGETLGKKPLAQAQRPGDFGHEFGRDLLLYGCLDAS